jgi:hypothetical protein
MYNNMSSKGEVFKSNLDNLIKLFKKFKEKMQGEEYANYDKTIFSNLDLLINNYDLIKNNFPDEVFEQMGEPLQNMILDAIEQLKRDVGDINNDDSNYITDIRKIDELLKQGNIDNSEIDRLLDQRNQLISKIGSGNN